MPILQIDISDANQRAVLEELIALDKVLYVHLAPPCGTASAARQIKPGPPPLRSVIFPMGLPHLNFVQSTRVRKANFLYAWTCKIVLMLDSRGIGWSIENPASSLMWITDPFTDLVQALPHFVAFSFHTCMFGAPRKKDTAIWTSVAQLRTHLERKCDDKHPHLKWGRTQTGFATAEECAYNDAMCASWSEAVFDFAISKGFSKPPATVQEVTVSTTPATYVNKAILGCLPRGRKVVPFLSDFLEPRTFDISAMPHVQTLTVGKRIPDDCSPFPKGSKLLRFVNDIGGDGVKTELGLPKLGVIGIPRSPSDFLDEVCKLTHPIAMAMNVSELITRNMDAYNDPSGLAFRKVQCEVAAKLVRKCSELANDEAAKKSDMEDHVRSVLSNKRVVLFKQLMDEIQYPDAKLADELAQGFPLCGWLPASGVFPVRVRPPEIHEDFLWKLAPSISARTIASVSSTGCKESDESLWQATLEEVQDGFLEGPFEKGDLSSRAVVSPRFGLQQKNKLRPIDNFSASQVNGATGLQDKFVVDAVDEICALIKAWIQRSARGLCLVGKTFDMRKAYRQIDIKGAHLDLAWIAVWNPEAGKPALFRMRTMPFGATASVGAFLRISQAIKAIGIVSCGLVWSSFYDDYVCICKKGTELQTARMVRLLFRSLGWRLSEEPEKDKPFDEVFQALGVEFDLRSVPEGKFHVANTASRKGELKSKLEEILQADRLEPSVAESLRSRLLFADSQLFGRHTKMALQRIGSVGLGRKAEEPIGLDLKRSILWLMDHLLNGVPRTVTCDEKETFFIFLDGACTEVAADNEWSGTSVGGVLVDRQGRLLRFFGHVVSQSLVDSWSGARQVQHIFEAEVLPYAICLEIWADVLRDAALFVFIDNEAAKASWIAGSALSETAKRILHHGTVREAKLNVHPFFARVPTFSNLADDPSRGQFSELNACGAVRTPISDDLIAKLCAPPRA